MRTEFVYSIIALGAIPVVVNAAGVDVQAKEISKTAMPSTNGKLDLGKVTLAPGSYTLKGSLLSKVYPVKVLINGEQVGKAIDASSNATELSIPIDLTKATAETEVSIELESTDPTEPGADFTLGTPYVNLTFDFASIKSTLVANANALKTTNIPAYPYTSTDDATAVDNLVTEINAIAETYEAYVAQKLYQDASVPQGKIEALAATIADHQNTQAYNDVNALITAIKTKYNDAVADIKASLVNEAAYLLGDAQTKNTALYDLNENINKKITAATSASYASYTGKTAVADKATIVEDMIPTEEALNNIVNDWKGQGTTNQTAYNTLHAKVTALQADLDAIKPVESIASLFPKTEAQAAIDAVNADVEAAKNSAAQLTLDVSAKETDAQGKISTLAGKVNTANAEFDANKNTTKAIAAVQKAYNDAKNTVDAKVSKDGDYKAADYYADYLKTQQDAIDKLTSDAAAAYKEDGTGTAQTYNAGLADKTAPIIAAIDNYQNKAVEAVEKYDALQTAMASYQKDLDAARDQVKDLDVYTAEGYDYETEFNKIQKRINDIKKAITTAQEKKGTEHWTAMLAIDSDAAISNDIATLLSKVQADENKYDADHLADGMTTLEGKITAFQAKDATVLGEDVAKFQKVENDINDAYNDVKKAKEDINAQSETVDYTAKVGTEAADWSVASGNNYNRAKLSNGQVEHYGETAVGDMIWQEVSVENGIYDIEVLATSHNANGGASLEEDAKDVAYVFGKGENEVQTWITARKNNGFVSGEPETYEIKGVKVENGKLTIGLHNNVAGKTNWHTIQIKSLKANTASLIQGWGKKVDDLNDKQTALETTANAVAAKVATNTSNKTTLATSIGDNEATPKTGMWKSIDDFKTQYKIGTAESTLGNRGKADGEVTKAVATLVDDLTALQTANSEVDPTKVTNYDDKSSAVNNTPSGWALVDMAHTGNSNRLTGDKIDGKQLAEQYTSATAADYGKAGIVMKQKLTGLANGIYDVVLYANAVDQADKSPNNGRTDIAYVYANDDKESVPVTSGFNADQEGYSLKACVTDGTLELGLAKAKGGTNWHSILLKSLKLHDNSQDALYNNADEKNPGLNNRYTKLNNTLNALKEAAPGIVDAVKANADINTAATKAVADLQTAELNKLKSLKNVTNETAVNDEATALKEAPAGYEFKVFETGLAADKNYTAKKKAIDDDIKAMSDAIAASNANESLKEDWKDNSITVVITPDDEKTPDVDETVKKTYSIAVLTQTINDLKTEAGSESDNWEAYKSLLDNNWSKLLPDTITVDAADMGADAVAYYQGLKDSYIAGKATILKNMQADLKARKSVSTKDAFVTEINALIAKVKVVKSDGIANYKKYLEQKKAYQETQTLWNSTYTEIAATDQSSKVQEWLDKLDAIQVTLTAATNAVETNYPKGESVAKAQDFATIQNAINDVKAQQQEAYNAQITADNKAAHESFMGTETTKGTIQLATEAYQRAVQERAKYSSTNEQIKAAVDAAAATLDKALFNCPGDIATLTQQENEAYAAVVSPTVFDVSDFNVQANKIAKDITDELNDFKAAVKAAINNDVWAPNKNVYTAELNAAKDDISGYSDAAKKDAFKDVEDLIAKGDAGVASITLSEVEEAIAGLENIDDMLAADKDAAAVKDITVAKAAADKAYSDTKAYIEGKTIADDVNNVKATQLKNLEDAKADADAALIDEDEKPVVVTFANHDGIKPALTSVVTVANAAKAAVDAAIADDVKNTEAYNEMVKAIEPVEAKLAEAKAAAAPYKYETSFGTDEGRLNDLNEWAADAKENGYAVADKDDLLQNAKDLSADIEATLTKAFATEKTGLATDISELKNQFNAYVAANGLNETANAFKADIDALEKAVSEAAIKDLDDPADGIQYDEILDATAKLVALQESIADKETELLEANASTANAEVLADFNNQIAEMEKTASLEGYDKWVADQPYGDTTLGEAITDLKAQIADVKAAVNAEKNISFYKDQYQAQIDAIEADLVPVTVAIAAYDKQFKDNAAAYERLTAEINELQKAIDDAKAKVGEYEYVGPGKTYDYTSFIEQYTGDPAVLTNNCAQGKLNAAKETIEAANENRSLKENTAVPNKFQIENRIKYYLDGSAKDELNSQRTNLYDLLFDAIDAKYVPETYSSALWAILVAQEAAIDEEIDALEYPIWNSWQTYKSTGINKWVYDNDNNRIAKERTSDADYADQIAEVNRIKEEIANLGDAVDNLNLLGDANVDGKVNVLDYQKVLNMILDPTQQPEEDTDLFTNIDINQSTVIEVGDLTAIVNYILNQEWKEGYAAARSFNRGDNENLSLNYSSVNSDVQRIAVNLENANDYTAFQMDVVLPDGMKIVGTSLSSRAGQSHKLYSRTQQDGSVRILASSISGETFSGNEGAVLYIDVEGANASSVEILNILFSDVNANTRAFKLGNNVTGIDAIGSTFDALKQKVYDLGGRVMNGVKKGINIIRNADGSTRKVAE